MSCQQLRRSTLNLLRQRQTWSQGPSLRNVVTNAAPVAAPVPGFVEPVLVAPPPPPPPAGGFVRGGIVGLLLGLTLAGGTAYVYLLDEYQQSSSALLISVEALQKSTEKVREYTKKIEQLERDFKTFAGKAVTKSELSGVRTELLKTIDDVNISHLELKTHVWEVEQDVKALKK
ncbi:hypothetical protein DFS34DRAFT_588992 [Phlyctochytrium arcticum]|nr:hypothetical protein DFS34DRAFT_588992 [Phlyctochytrium arcticum]